jgi:hypothetical protein
MNLRLPAAGLLLPLAAIALLVVVVWIGLRVVPAPLPAFPGAPGTVETVALPPGLPAPVERFYRVLHGEEIPVIRSVVLSGRAEIRPFGRLTLQGRFRFTHIAGTSYRHYIEATFFGLPIMRVNERYLDGVSLFETPAGVEQAEPKTEQAANIGMWVELAAVPAALLTDPRVRWEPLDVDTAVLVVPGDPSGEEHLVVRFDPETGLATLIEAMRYQKKDSAQKTLWIARNIAWESLAGFTTGTVGSAWWYGADRPWAIFRTESVVLNPDLEGYIRATGP